VLDPLGDTTDGEGQTHLGEIEAEPASGSPANAEIDAFRNETHIQASDAILEAGPGMEAAAETIESRARGEAVDSAKPDATEAERAEREPANLQRLQKILSQAGIASRRRAEEMITEGRVMVNGQVVTTLGSKADPARDHIRVDGKLLHGAVRHRYFMLNKPRGFVTTVSDPEGRPTVMQFFGKMGERVYPVGRLDFQSEGLLLMTNDGELANLLTKAGSGVEKTYLVKVAGQPSEQELERLRGGVTIERAEEGSGRVQTAPARVRQVRVGDNPWFEVVLIEGRNRELRKMFSAVGHFVEKIRRVGYGPLVLDVEPGKMRELTTDEVNALRLTAEGKMKPRRVKVDRVLPKTAGMAAEERFEKRGGRGGEQRESGGNRRFDRPAGRGAGIFKPNEGQSSGRPSRTEWKPRVGAKPAFGSRLEIRPFNEPKPEFEKRSFDRPRFEKPRFERPAGERGAGKPGGFRERPKFEGRKPFGGEKRPFDGGRPSSGPRREFGGPRGDRPRVDRPKFERPGTDRPRFDKPGFGKRSFGRPRFDNPRFEKPAFGGAPGGPSEGRQEDRPRGTFRAQGVRPGGFKRSAKPSGFKGPGSPGGAGRPKPGFGGRPGGFGKSNRPGGFAKSSRPGGFKRPNRPGGGGRSGPRFGGGRPGGR